MIVIIVTTTTASLLIRLTGELALGSSHVSGVSGMLVPDISSLVFVGRSSVVVVSYSVDKVISSDDGV